MPPSTMAAARVPPVTVMSPVIGLPFAGMAMAMHVPMMAFAFILLSAVIGAPSVIMATTMRLRVSVMP